jgi:FdhD protein
LARSESTAPATAPADESAAGFVTRPVDRWRHGQATHENDSVAEEVPVAMHYNGTSFAVMMVTPQDLDDFALGFSLSEGLIERPEQLLAIEQRTLLEGIELAMTVADDTPAARIGHERERLLPGRSGCGICGTRDLEQAVRQHAAVGAGIRITRAALEQALVQLQTMQPINAATGAVHAAGWADPTGQVHLVREDVGRHNALDKLVGALRRADIAPGDGMIVVTSRASYEMVTKAAAAGVSVLAAISAPTALAIELARSAGITLIGFTRPGSHNIYTHPERLRAMQAPA